MFRCLARYANVTSGEPSRIMRCTVIRLLKTTVHVASRRRYCSALNTSPTPASPECVATRMCSMYFVLGGAACANGYLISTTVATRRGGKEAARTGGATDLNLGCALDRLLEGARHCSRWLPASKRCGRTALMGSLDAIPRTAPDRWSRKSRFGRRRSQPAGVGIVQ